MELSLSQFSGGLLQKMAAEDILKCNKTTAKYGLVLTEQAAVSLAETRSYSLSSNGRIEFGGGIVDKLILAFCDSPFISQQNYEQTISELIELFYYFKNETNDKVTDTGLIRIMKKAFDGECQGSTELLESEVLERLVRRSNGNSREDRHGRY